MSFYSIGILYPAILINVFEILIIILFAPYKMVIYFLISVLADQKQETKITRHVNLFLKPFK